MVFQWLGLSDVTSEPPPAPPPLGLQVTEQKKKRETGQWAALGGVAANRG